MEYGKFSSAEELLKGYESLEKSFTQKCQELSALKQTIEQSQQDDGTSGQPSPSLDTSAQSSAEDLTVPTSSGADSLTGPVAEEQPTIPPRVMTGGGNVSMALPSRPKTLKEASELAKKMFN